MRSSEQIEAREVEQFRLVERILHDLHEHTRDHDDYRRCFRAVIRHILNQFESPPRVERLDEGEVYVNKVERPINAVATSAEERHYLLALLYQKVSASILTGPIAAYKKKQLLDEVSEMAKGSPAKVPG